MLKDSSVRVGVSGWACQDGRDRCESWHRNSSARGLSEVRLL